MQEDEHLYECYDPESQRRRYEYWRKKLALGIAIFHMPKSVKEYQKRVRLHKLSVREACQLLEDQGFRRECDQARKHLFERERGDLE